MAETPKVPSDIAEASAVPQDPNFGMTFFYYFTTSALVATLLAVKGGGVVMGSGLQGELALGIGLVGGLLGAFYNHMTTLTVPFTRRKTFLKTLADTLAAMGYSLAEEVDGVQVYRRSPVRQLFSGKIYVQLHEKEAILASRAMHIRALKKRLQSS
jgi:hypothetical protein